MGKVLSFKKMAARLRGKKGEEPNLTAGEKRAMMEMATAITLTAAQREDALFFANVDQNSKAMKLLRGTARYQFMKAVFNDSLQRFMDIKTSFNLGNLNQRSYWSFPDRPNRAYFVNPTHVCRTYMMAVALWKEEGVDFKQPDAEGHLPMYFLARYAKDKAVILMLASHFNLNANDSGRDPVTHEAFEAPLIRAIKYGNVYAVRSLRFLAPKNVDLNQRATLGLTPLMLAVLHAEEALKKYACGETSAQDVKKRLWIVRFLGASPLTDHTLNDPTGFKAADYAVSPQTQAVLKASTSQKENFLKYFMS